MTRVACSQPSSFMGYQWPYAGAEVEMSDGDAARLMEIAGPDAGYTLLDPPEPVPAAKPARARPTAKAADGGN